MLIATAYYGDARFGPMVEAWINAHRRSGTQMPFVVLTDEQGLPTPLPGCSVLQVDTRPYSDLIRPGFPFDRKGAIQCAALQLLGPVLFLDADAWLRADPQPVLHHHAEAVIAMCTDACGIETQPRFVRRDGATQKYNSGVIWFGEGNRRQTVEAYREAFLGLVRDPRLAELDRADLAEQWAWSMVMRTRGGERLPDRMNWHSDKEASGGVVVEHNYGPRKWRRVLTEVAA